MFVAAYRRRRVAGQQRGPARPRHTVPALDSPPGHAEEPAWSTPSGNLIPRSIQGYEMARLAAAPERRRCGFFDDAAPDFMAVYSSSPFAQENEFALLESLLNEEKLGQVETFDLVCFALSPMALLAMRSLELAVDARNGTCSLDRQIEATLET